MPFSFEKLRIRELVLITPRIFSDNRGYFFESYKLSEFTANGVSDTFVQDNISKSSRGVLRGLHYQIEPFAQGKLIRCLSGSIFDVAVDIRKNSPTCGQWQGIELNEQNQQMLYIPPGFAHGFYTLSDKTEVMYKVTAEYNPASERGIIWNDNEINIRWPSDNPLLSEKDAVLKNFKNAEIFD